MSIVRDPEHSDGAPTIEGTGIRMKDIAVAYEHSGYEPDEITQLYPDLSLGDVHRALAYYYDNIDNFLSLIEGAGFEHAGIIYVQQAGRDIGDVVKAIDAHLESRSEDDRGIHYC